MTLIALNRGLDQVSEIIPRAIHVNLAQSLSLLCSGSFTGCFIQLKGIGLIYLKVSFKAILVVSFAVPFKIETNSLWINVVVVFGVVDPIVWIFLDWTYNVSLVHDP
jgi:hypothetical protein